MIELRDYQEEAVKLAVESYRMCSSNHEMLVLPCGAGKTVIFSSIVKFLAGEYGLNALILAHRDELLDQAIEKYRLVEPAAIIGKISGQSKEYGAPVTVASIATVSRTRHLRRLQALYGTGKGLIIVCDECHHIQSDGYQRVLSAFPDSFVLGVTATPDRLDKKLIFDGKEPLFSMSIIDMVKQRYLVDMRCIAIKTDVTLDKDVLHTRMGDFVLEELDKAVNTASRNKRIVDAYQEHAAGKRTIAFCVSIDHAEALTDAFNEAGVPAATITGSTPMDERHRLYTRLRSGEILVLTSVMVLSEGFDEPSVECVIMARPTQSRALFIQCIGRALRLYAGKKEAIILDITDNCLKHRLMPVNLRKALDWMNLQDDETIEEALEREEQKKEQERLEYLAQIRKLKESRVRDIQVNLLEKIEWTSHNNDEYWSLEMPHLKHRFAIIPCKDVPGCYELRARPYLNGTWLPAQKWSGNIELEECQQLAEKLCMEISAEPKMINIYNKAAKWRHLPISEPQKKMLKWYRIAFTDEMSREEASKLIDEHKKDIEARKAVKAARKAAKEAAAS